MTGKWKTIKIEGIDWTYQVMGSGKQTLVIFPGGLRRPLEESYFIEQLAGQYKIVSPVYPRISSLQLLSEGITTILDQEKIRKANIYGSSFGGIMAQAFAVYFPEKINKIIIGNTGTKSDNPEFSVRINKALKIIRFLPAFIVRSVVLRSFTRVVPEGFEGREKVASAIRELVKSRKLDKPDILCHFESLLDFKTNVDLTSKKAASIAKKLLVITATGDRGVSPDSVNELHTMYPKAKFYHFDKGGHMPMLVFPEKYVKIITDFLGK